MRTVPADWRIVKLEQKGLCDTAWVASKKLESCGVFYLLDANLHVHICSLTPVLEAWPIHGYAIFATEEAFEADEGDAEMEMMRGEEAVSYFGLKALENPWKPATDFVNIPEQEDGEEDEEYRMRVADEVRDVLCGNPVWF